MLLACGQWTRQLAGSVGVNVPVAIAPHQYAVFEPMGADPNSGRPLVDNSLPVVRDYEPQIYIKPEVGGLMVGMFEGPHAMMPEEVAARNSGDSEVPAGASHELYTGTTDKMESGLMAAMGLVPALAEQGIKQLLHGPDTHSVDHEPLLGRAPRTDNLWVATGFNSLGIQLGPAIGLAMAEWMTTGEPGATLEADFAEMDVRRFHPQFTADPQWCTARALEGYATEYAVHYPAEEFSSDERARGVRLSPLHDCIAGAGAVFGAVGPSGFERPLHFGEDGEANAEGFYTHERLSYDAREAGWWGAVEAEHRAAREGAALFDLSSFGKLKISGSGAEAAMEWCASSEVGSADTGRVIYTQMLNERGGVESDLTIVPQPETGADGREFYVVTSSATCTRDADNIARASRLRGIEDVQIQEITDDWAVLALMGPESRQIAQAVFPGADFGNEGFPFGTSQELDCEAATGVRALRVSFVGELGWELHCPSAQAPSLWRALHAAGGDVGANGGAGLANAGYRALLLSLRLEKKFVHFGHDLSPTDSPLEAGLGFVVSAAPWRLLRPCRGAMLSACCCGLLRRAWRS